MNTTALIIRSRTQARMADPYAGCGRSRHPAAQRVLRLADQLESILAERRRLLNTLAGGEPFVMGNLQGDSQ